MLRSKVLIVALAIGAIAALSYNLMTLTRGGRAARPEKAALPSEGKLSAEVGGVYISLESFDELLRYEVKRSNRNPFERVGEVKSAEVAPEKASDTSGVAGKGSRLYYMLGREGRGSGSKGETASGEEAKVKAVERPNLELKGIVIGGSARFAIINDEVFSEGELVGDERIVRITPESVLLERDGEVKELRLKRSPAIPIEVRRAR